MEHLFTIPLLLMRISLKPFLVSASAEKDQPASPDDLCQRIIDNVLFKTFENALNKPLETKE